MIQQNHPSGNTPISPTSALVEFLGLNFFFFLSSECEWEGRLERVEAKLMEVHALSSNKLSVTCIALSLTLTLASKTGLHVG